MIFSSKNLICLDLLSILVWMSLSEEVRKERGMLLIIKSSSHFIILRNVFILRNFAYCESFLEVLLVWPIKLGRFGVILLLGQAFN